MTMEPRELIDLMASNHISQKYLAELLGVRPETVSRWVKGKNRISGPVARAIRSLLKQFEKTSAQSASEVK